ncbi:MAG TPA: isocitrate/isopropylmalate dehydrogenase family protein [Myxococcales bacterium]|nr:isocitrate/isopropylmalate dehydrogenase family protein [Myxococcales bacterium]
MAHSIALLAGDGIGPEVVAAAARVVEATGVAVSWIPVEAGAEVIAKHGTALPQATVETILRTGVALKGPTATPVGGGHPSANVALRKALDLYANLRPVRSQPGVRTRYEAVDLVVVRENTEDLYSGIEHIVVPGVVETLKIITERASTRIAEFAFAYAERERRGRITAVHKANIMKLSDGLFLDCCRKVARAHPAIAYDEAIVDACCMQLVRDPGRYDVLLLENLYGDIVSDLCAGLVGGLGLVPGANLGERVAVFEAVHGSAPDIAGKGIANPTACLRSAGMMLRHLNEPEAAARIDRAIDRVLGSNGPRTPDLGGKATTSEYAQAVIAAL